MKKSLDFATLGLFDARVPRYTSYPPATQFADKVGPAQMARWLEATPEGAQISLYIHIPFCRRLCWFCACRTQGTATTKPLHAYLNTLKTEIAQVRARLPDGVTLSRLHWGGGTPTLLPADMITELAGAVSDAFPFAQGYDFSVEIDPCEIDAARMDALAAAGMTRVSVGVQDFDPQVQATIGRIQSFDDTAAAIAMARDAGVHSVNADLLFGLPHQDESTMMATLDHLMALSPDRIALYGYAHVPWMARRQNLIPTDALPEPQARLSLFELAETVLVADGFVPIGIDHFALPSDSMAKAAAKGTLRRNFQGYTDDPAKALIGLGASAISQLPQGYAQNDPATAGYTASVRAGELATVRGHALSADDRLRGGLIERLMCDFAATAVTPAERDVLQDAALAFPDAVEFDGARLVIHNEAHPLARLLAHHIDAYATSGRHAPAI
ncbi:MAG: oxygen-independent coproporphyrinogen III oxidase [Pseudomonadota bacterium]